VVFHLVLVPAAADPEQEPPAGYLVEGRDQLGGLDRVALDDETDAGTELELFRGGGRGGQRHERVHHVVILLRQVAAGLVGRAARGRDVRVLRGPDRLKPARLERLREIGGPHRIIGKEHRGADLHGSPPS